MFVPQITQSQIEFPGGSSLGIYNQDPQRKALCGIERPFNNHSLSTDSETN